MKEENIKYLSNVIDENKLSHAFLVESNNYEDVMNSVFKLFLENPKDLLHYQNLLLLFL